MTQLIPIELEDGTIIHIQAEEPDKPQYGETKRGLVDKEPQKQVTQNFQQVQTLIRVYTTHTLNAFKNLAIAEVSEVTLEFGINVEGSTGIPYIANGKVGSSLKITVKCKLPAKHDN